MLTFILGIIVTAILGAVWGYIIHKIVHKKWSGPLYKAHLTHHVKLYPCHDFQSSKYRDAGKDNTTFIFLAMCLPIGLVPLLLWLVGIISLPLLVTVISEMIIIGFINSYLHDSFHIKNHWLNKVPVFNKFYQHLIEEHFVHHQYVQKNFGIYSFGCDKVFGTYKKSK